MQHTFTELLPCSLCGIMAAAREGVRCGREKCVPTFLRVYITSVYGYRSTFLDFFLDKNVMVLPTYCVFPHLVYCQEDFSLSVYLDPDSPWEGGAVSSLLLVPNPEWYQHH